GLVIFAGTARVRLPLTTDTQAAIRVLDTIETGTVLVDGGSNLAAGLDAAGLLLQSAGSSPAEALILLISDGEDLGDPAAAAAAASALGNTGTGFFVAGVGTPDGSTIPALSLSGLPSVRRDAEGNPIVSRLDE